MNYSKILVTGGSGRLGTELKKYLPTQYYPTHKKLDITKPIKKGKYRLIINCAGYTDVAKAEKENEKCYTVNVIGTRNLVEAYLDTPFVFISSEYAVNPVNFYSETKDLEKKKFQSILDI